MLRSRVTYVGKSPNQKWFPQFLLYATRRAKVRYQDAWAFLAGGFAYVQDYHNIDLAALEELQEELIPEAMAAGAHVVTFPAPDEVADRWSRRNSLSEEALYVIDLILNGPAEILEAICTPARKQPSKSLIRKYLKRQGWSKEAVASTMDELKAYVGEL